MSYNPAKHHRRSIRLKGYDYSEAGIYFLTICTHQRECLFGEIIDGEMKLIEFGKIVLECWQAIPKHFSRIELDEFIVMPNHIHGILVMKDYRNNAIDDGRGLAMPTPTRVNLVIQLLVLCQQLLVLLNLLLLNR